MYYANVNVHLILKNITQIKIGITINVGTSVKIKKKHVCQKYTWNPATCSYKNGKTLASIIDDSEIQKHEK